MPLSDLPASFLLLLGSSRQLQSWRDLSFVTRYGSFLSRINIPDLIKTYQAQTIIRLDLVVVTIEERGVALEDGLHIFSELQVVFGNLLDQHFNVHSQDGIDCVGNLLISLILPSGS